MILTVVRHGQTEWNAARRLQGSTDIPLNETGRRQAEETASLLAGERFDRAFSSPLLRAFETGAAILRGRDLTLVPDERLRERGYGCWEGRPKDAEVYAGLWAYGKNESSGQVEPVRSCFARVYSFLDEIVKRYPEERILLTTHAGVAKVIRCYVLGMMSDRELADYVPANALPERYTL